MTGRGTNDFRRCLMGNDNDLVVWNGCQYRRCDLPAGATDAVGFDEWRLMTRQPVQVAAVKPSPVAAAVVATKVRKPR